MSRWSRAYALDALVVAVAIGGALEVVIRRNAEGAPESSLWFAAPAMALLALPLLARRRYPFASPAGLWVVAAVLSFVDGELVTFTASATIAGLAASDHDPITVEIRSQESGVRGQGKQRTSLFLSSLTPDS